MIAAMHKHLSSSVVSSKAAASSGSRGSRHVRLDVTAARFVTPRTQQLRINLSASSVAAAALFAPAMHRGRSGRPTYKVQASSAPAVTSDHGAISEAGRAAWEKYEADMSPARANFGTYSGLDGFLSHLSQLDRPDAQRLLTSMLLVFCGVGSKMTAPVQSWMYRAGQACIDRGYTSIGQELMEHSTGEAGHDKWYVNDTRAIAAFMKSELSIDNNEVAQRLLNQEIVPEPVRQYDVLHEDVIASQIPFTQLAIETEIELLSLTVAKPLLQQINTHLGQEFIKKCLTFLWRHVEADEDHTVENEGMIMELLGEHPGAVDELVAVGVDSLRVYGNHVRHCIGEGYKLAGVQQPKL